jgi:hypothetical protein
MVATSSLAQSRMCKSHVIKQTSIDGKINESISDSQYGCM